MSLSSSPSPNYANPHLFPERNWRIEQEFPITWNRVNPKFLKREFVRSYIHQNPPFGQLGLVVFLRTYSRFLSDLGRREHWWETVLRVTEYSLSLHQGSAYSQKQLEQEAKELFDGIFHLRLFPAGRTLWIGGSNNTDGTSHFNCSFRGITDLQAFSDIFYLLLVGAGTGFSVQSKDVSQLPSFDSSIELVFKPYFPLKKQDRQEETTWLQNEEEVLISVGDSRQGWVKALDVFLHAFSLHAWDKYEFQKVSRIRLIFDSVRPEGELLKTMGGRASGHRPLEHMFQSIQKVFQREKGKLTSVGAMDVCNLIAQAVVVGGVRRSSQIALGDATDHSFQQAKFGLWTDPQKEPYRGSRVMSNNSLMLYERPSLDFLKDVMHMIKDNGEPGFINCEEASRRRENFHGVNPCAEILLDSCGVCNLTEVNMRAFVKGVGVFDRDGFLRAVRLAARVGSRMTNTNLWSQDWDRIQKRDRLLGVSLTGQQDAWDALGFSFSNPSAIAILQQAKETARQEADHYHKAMDIPPSLLVTTVKPSGTISQLPGTSSGIHRSYAPHYLRRIRISKTDPLAQTLRDLGLPCSPENNQGPDIDAEECNTLVFTFPVQTHATTRAVDEPALQQLERYKIAMENYVEHNCSVTISVAPEEWDDVAQWLAQPQNWSSYVGVSFLPKFDDRVESPFPQMPYETSTAERLKDFRAMNHLTEFQLLNALRRHEDAYIEQDLEGSDCAGSTCPIR